MTLTLNQAVRSGDVVVLLYTPPGVDPLQDRATTPNAVATFTTGQGDVPGIDNTTPGVRTVTFAGTAATLTIGDKVEIDAVFTQAVTVRTSSTARPQIGVLIGTETRQARYVSGTGSATLRFEYEVADGDEDTDGIEIATDALTVPSGSSIRTQTDNRTVQLAHDAVAADAARTVDGVRPTVSSAAVEGPTLIVTWSEALDENSIPAGAGGMTVRIGNANGPAVTAVSVTGSTTVLKILRLGLDIPPLAQILDEKSQLVRPDAFRVRKKFKVDLLGRLRNRLLVHPAKYLVGHCRPDMAHLRLKVLEDPIRALCNSQVLSGCCLFDRRSGDVGTVVPESALLAQPRGQTGFQAVVETFQDRNCRSGNKVPASGTR